MELGEIAAVRAALDALSLSLDHLVKIVEDGGLETFTDAQLVGFLQGFERVRNRLPLVDHQVISDGIRRLLPESLCQTNMARVLASAVRISAGEAARRVRAAEVLAERMSMTGEPLDPIRPHVAAAQRAGEVTPEQVGIITQALARVDRPGFDPADIAAGEELLTRFAAEFGPKELTRLAEQVIDAIDPDGSLPKEKLNADRRYVHLKQTQGGGYAGEFRLTAACGAKLTALLGPLARPRVNTATSPDGRLIEQPDPRHHGQRMHDALEDLCDRLLRTETAVPDAGGTPATVILTIDSDDLQNRTGYGVTGDGTLIRTDTVRALTDSAEVYTAFTSSTGEVLRLGRTRRIASRAQTVALIARDHGCSFPGCDTAPGMVRTTSHRALDRRRHHRPAESDPAVPLSPPQLHRQRLGLPDQPRRATRMATTPVDRPIPNTHDQHPDPRPTRRHSPPTAVDG